MNFIIKFVFAVFFFSYAYFAVHSSALLQWTTSFDRFSVFFSFRVRCTRYNWILNGTGRIECMWQGRQVDHVLEQKQREVAAIVV